MPNEQKDMSVIRLGLINKQGNRIEPAKTGKGSLVPWSIMGVALATGANSHSDNPQTNTPETNTPPVLSLRPLKWLTISNADKATGALKPIDDFNPIRGQFIAIDIDKDILTYSVINRPDNEMDFGKFTLNPNTGEWVFAFNEDITFDEFVNLMFEIKIEDGKGGEDIEIFTIILGNSDGVLVEPLSDNELNRILADVDEELGDLILPVSDTEPDLFGRPPFINRDDPQDDPRDYFPDDRDDPRDDNRDNTRGDTPDETPDDMLDDPTDSVNNAPVLTPSSYGRTITDESADGTNVPDPTSGVFMAMDADNDDLIWTVDEPSNVGDFGSFTFSEDTGVWVFMPNAGINSLGAGVREVLEFTITVNDQNGGRDTATVTITLEGVNDAPREVISDGLSVTEGGEREITTALLQFTDVDNDSEQLIYTITDAPDHGTLLVRGVNRGSGGTFTQADIDAGRVRYDHRGGEEDSDSFTYSVSDGAESDPNTNTVMGSFSITILESNDAPEKVSEGRLTGVSEGGVGIITNTLLRFTDMDNEAEDLTYTISAAPQEGNLQRLIGGTWEDLGSRTFTQADIDAGRVRYEHLGGEEDSDRFTYSVSDGVNTVMDTFNIIIGPVNDAPTATEGGVLDKATIESGHDDGGGVIPGDNIASGTFTHDDGDDGEGGFIGGTPEVARVGSSSYTPIMGGATSATIDGIYGTLTLMAGTWSYELNNAEGFPANALDGGDTPDTVTDSFLIRIRDTAGAVSNAIPIDIRITGTNDRPVISALDGTNGMHTISDGDPDGQSVFNNLTRSASATDPDADDDADDLTWAGNLQGTSPTGFGTLNFDPNNPGRWTFAPNDAAINALSQGEQRVLVYDITVTDPQDAISEMVPLTITLVGINDAPELAVNVVADDVIEAGGTDNNVAGDAVARGSLTITDADTGQDSFTFAGNTLQGRSVGGGTTTFTDAGTAIEGIYGTLTLNDNDGTWSYALRDDDLDTQALDGGDIVQDVFEIQLVNVDAGNPETSAIVPITIQVTGTNDAPVITPLDSNGMHIISDEDPDGESVFGDLTGNASATDLDADDGDDAADFTWAGTLQGTSPTGFGTLSFDEGNPGRWTFDPDEAAINALSQGEQEVLVYDITVTDRQGAISEMVPLTITLMGINDAPEKVNAGSLTGVSEGGVGIITGTLLRFTDVDNEAEDLTYTISAAPQEGNLQRLIGGTWEDLGSRTFTQADIDAGRVRYEHLGGEEESDRFTYSVSDGANPVPDIFNIVIGPVNDAPTAAESGVLDKATIESGHDDGGGVIPGDDVASGTFTHDDGDDGEGGFIGGTAEVARAGSSSYTPIMDGATSATIDGMYGTLTLTAGTWSYELNNAEGFPANALDGGDTPDTVTDSFLIRIRDTAGAVSNAIPIDIRITGTNDRPVISALDGTNGMHTISDGDPDGQSEFGDLTRNASATDPDADDDADDLTWAGNLQGTSPTGFGTLNFDPNNPGRWTFAPNDAAINALSQGEQEVLVYDITVTDPQDAVSEMVPLTITLVGINDAPELAVNVVADDVIEAGGTDNNVAGDAVARGSLTITDADTGQDSFTFAGNTLQGRSVGGGTTTFTDAGTAIEGIYGTLTLNDNDGTWSYALRDDDLDTQALDGGDMVQDVFEIQLVNVDAGNPETSAIVPLTIQVTGTNDAPVITPLDSNGMHTIRDEDPDGESVFGDLTGNASATDPDADDGDDAADFTWLGTLQGTSPTGFGTLSFDEGNPGRWTFDPDEAAINALSQGEQEVLVYDITVTDRQGAISEMVPLTITLMGINDAPEKVNAGSLTGVSEGGVGIITGTLLRFTDVDNEAEDLTYTISAAPQEGNLQRLIGGTWEDLGSRTFTQADIDAGRVRYEHLGGEEESDRFTYSVSDGANPVPDIFNIVIGPVNDVPTATESGGLDKATIESGHDDGGGVILGDDMASGTFTHDDGDDDEGNFIGGTPEVARAGSSSYTPIMDGATSATIDGIYGTLTLMAGTWSYELNNAEGFPANALDGGDTVTDSFLIRIRDTAGAVSNAIPIDIRITGTNDRPVISALDGTNGMHTISDGDPDGQSVFSDLTRSASATDPDADDDADDLTWAGNLQGTSPTGFGTLSFDPNNPGRWTFAPDAAAINSLSQGEQRVLVYDITVTDPQDAISEMVPLTITLVGINDAPELAVNVVDDDVTEAGGTDNNVAGDAVARGSLTITDADTGQDSFTFAGNTLQGRSVGGGTTTFTDAGTAIEGIYGTLTLNDNDGTWSYALRDDDPDTQALDGGDTSDMVQDVFEIQLVNVDAGNPETSAIVPITIDVTGANDAPVITPLDGNGMHTIRDEDPDGESVFGDLTGNASATDPDADDGDDAADFTWLGTLQGASPTGFGTLIFDPSNRGRWTFDPDEAAINALSQGEQEVLVYDITVTDRQGAISEMVPLTITLMGINDAPEKVNAGSLTGVSEGGVGIITGTLLRFTDVDNEAEDLTYTISAAPQEGNLQRLIEGTWEDLGSRTFTQADIDAGRVRYEHLGGEEESDRFTYSVSDGANPVPDIFNIVIVPVNDVPTAAESGILDKATIESGHDDGGGVIPGDNMASGTFTHDDGDDGEGDFIGGTPEVARAGSISPSYTPIMDGAASATIDGIYGTLTLMAGTWSYELNNAEGFPANALDGGDTVTDSFLIRIRDTAGAVSNAIPIDIMITGTNDRPVISALDGTNGMHTISDEDPDGQSEFGDLTHNASATDPDADDDADDLTWAGNLQGTSPTGFGTLSFDPNNPGRWTFAPDAVAINALSQGEQRVLVYDITVTDPQDAVSEMVPLTITLVGGEDAPTLMLMDTQTPRAKERGGHGNNQRTTSATSGTLAVALTGAVALGAFAYADADAADTGFGAGGTIQGRHRTDQNMNNDNDYEDGSTVNGMNIAGTYGTLSLRADGSWEYVLNEANAAVQALNDGDRGVLAETFQFRIQDIVGTTTNNIYSNVITIDIDIEGTNDAPELTVTYDETTEVSRFVQEDTTSDTQSGDLTFADVDQDDTIPGLIVFASTTDGGIGSGTEDTTPPLPTATNVMRVDAGATTTVRDDYGDFELTRDATTGQVAWTYRIDDIRARELRQWVDGQANSEEIQTLYVRAWDKASGGLASDIHTIQVEVRGTNDAPEIAELGTLDKAITESGHGDAVGVNVFADDDGVTGDVGLSALSVNNPNSDRVANGRFSFTDPDLGQGGFNTDVGGVNTITGGTIQAVHADDATSPTYTDVASTAATVATGQVFDATYGRFFVRIDGTWSYVVDNTRSVTQGLDEGDMMQDVFSIRVRDNDHAVAGTPADTVFSEALVIRVTITGTNDRPTIDDTNGGRTFTDASADDHTRPEGSAPQMFTGTAVASDVDADDGANGADDFRWVVVSSSTTSYGGLVFSNNEFGGDWIFTTNAENFNALSHGLRQTITYSVQAHDPQGARSVAADLTITLVGIDDVSTNLEHVDTGIDLEVQRPGGRDVDGDFAASGTLRFMDVDGDTFSHDHIFIQGNPRQVSFEVFAHEGDDEGLGKDINGLYGTLYLKDDGTWSYMLDNTRSTTQRITNGESEIERFHLRIESRITGRAEHLNSNILPLNIIVRGMEVMALTRSDALTDIIYDEVASGQIVAMVGARAPRGDTTFTVALNQDDDGTASLDNDIGRFEIGDDGSWTYTITSIPVLDRLAGRVGNGNATLDPGEMLTQTFYITAHNDTIPEPNREETIRVDVLINGMDIITPDLGSRIDPLVDGNTAYIGDDRANIFFIVNGRHIVFGGEGEDDITYNANHQGAVSFYHRFESLDSGGWENMDGSDFIEGFTRNQDSFTLVDIDDSPVSEDTFVGATGDIRLHAITLQRDLNRLVGFDLAFLDGAAIPQVISGIRFQYSGSGIDLSDMNNRNLFYGTSNINPAVIHTIGFTIEGTLENVDIRRVDNLSLLENYFGDSEDNFRVVDELPVVILDALTTGGSIFYDEIASGRAELPRDTTNLFVTIDEYYRDGTATSLDDGVGRFEVKADGSWTYTITSIPALHTAANAAGLGPTLDADEVLTRVFYLHALDETLSGANRLATLELDVVINGANIITPSPSFGLLSPVIRSDTAYIGDARDNQINFVDGRHIVFGSTGADTILVTNVVAVASIWHRFSSHDSVPWENTDGEDVNNHFTRNQDSFTFVDIDGTPVDEAAFLASPQTEFRAIIQLGELVGFDLRFVDPDDPSNMSIIQFDYTDPIFIPDSDIASFFGTGPLADNARVLINPRLASRSSVQVTDPNLWGHFFGDDDDSFRVVDDLPVVILDALTTGDGFLDDVSGRAEVPRDTTNLFVTLDETYTDTGRATALGDGVGRFEIKADGSWTYTITSIPALHTAANAAGLGPTLDADEVLTRTFYLHALDETLSGADRLATLELDVVINGANIITPDPLTGSLTPIISSDTVYIGDARDNQINSVNGRHIVFGSTGADTITDSTNVGVASIWHRFSSTDNGGWANTDGIGVINDFVRNEDTFTLVDINATPVSEAVFINNSQVQLEISIINSSDAIEYFALAFDNGNSAIRFNYETPINVSGDNGDPFLGVGRNGVQPVASTLVLSQTFTVTDRSLWGNYFGDHEDNFRVIDTLPAIIADVI